MNQLIPGRPEDVRRLVDDRTAELRRDWYVANHSGPRDDSAAHPVGRARARVGETLIELGRRVIPAAERPGLVRPVRSPDGC